MSVDTDDGGIPPAALDCITAAAQFMAAQPGAARRALAVHRPDASGRCIGCGHRGVAWPCVVVEIARRSQERC